MLNQFVVVGKVFSFTSTHVLLKVQRATIDSETKEYENDFLNIEVPHSIMNTLFEYLDLDNIIAVKASLISESTIDSVTNNVKIVAERASVLNPKTN